MNAHDMTQCLLMWISDHTIETAGMDIVNVSELTDEINRLGYSDE